MVRQTHLATRSHCVASISEVSYFRHCYAVVGANNTLSADQNLESSKKNANLTKENLK